MLRKKNKNHTYCSSDFGILTGQVISYSFKVFVSQGPALQYDLSKLEGESWRYVEFSDFTGTVMCWACLRRYSAVEKKGQRFARIQ